MKFNKMEKCEFIKSKNGITENLLLRPKENSLEFVR